MSLPIHLVCVGCGAHRSFDAATSAAACPGCGSTRITTEALHGVVTPSVAEDAPAVEYEPSMGQKV